MLNYLIEAFTQQFSLHDKTSCNFEYYQIDNLFYTSVSFQLLVSVFNPSRLIYKFANSRLTDNRTLYALPGTETLFC